MDTIIGRRREIGQYHCHCEHENPNKQSCLRDQLHDGNELHIHWTRDVDPHVILRPLLAKY
jgi:hypothetical protein